MLLKYLAILNNWAHLFNASFVSLTSLLVVKMLTALVSTVSNSQLFLLKNVNSFCKCKSYSHFFRKNISLDAIFNDQSFNFMLTNDIVSFKQLGPDILDCYVNVINTPNKGYICILNLTRLCDCLINMHL